MEKDKRGLVFTGTIALFIIGLIVTLVLLASFVFSSQLRWILIGIAIIAAGVWLLGQLIGGKGKMTGKKAFPVLLIILLGVGFIFGAGYLQTQFPGEMTPDEFFLEDGTLNCNTEEQCMAILEKAGMPDNYLKEENIKIECENGICEFKKA